MSLIFVFSIQSFKLKLWGDIDIFDRHIRTQDYKEMRLPLNHCTGSVLRSYLCHFFNLIQVVANWMRTYDPQGTQDHALTTQISFEPLKHNLFNMTSLMLMRDVVYSRNSAPEIRT